MRQASSSPQQGGVANELGGPGLALSAGRDEGESCEKLCVGRKNELKSIWKASMGGFLPYSWTNKFVAIPVGPRVCFLASWSCGEMKLVKGQIAAQAMNKGNITQAAHQLLYCLLRFPIFQDSQDLAKTDKMQQKKSDFREPCWPFG